MKRGRAALIRGNGAEHFAPVRLVLDDNAPLQRKVERVGAALERALGRSLGVLLPHP